MSGKSGRAFYELEVYKRYEGISNVLWKEVFTWKYELRDLLGHQMLRAVDSIGANIAESVGRGHWRDGVKFLLYARGSLTETQHWLRRASQQQLIDKDVLPTLREEITVLHKQLNAFIAAQAPESEAHEASRAQEDNTPYGDAGF